MGEPAYIVLPVSADGAQQPDQDATKLASAIQQSIYEKTHPEQYKESEHAGPLQQIIAHQDSLYRYISWEDPIRTLGSYIAALSVLFGAHYLPLTQWALKAGMTILGVVSISEFISRSFGPNSLSTRLRPKEYKTVPEPTLNATLKDIHDIIQYIMVQTQRIVFGQDLRKTFAAFLGFTALYWLINIVTPFGLAVMGLTALYIAPLLASPRGRAVAQDTMVRAEKLANAAMENGRGLAEDGKSKAAELSSKTRQATANAGGRIQNLAQSGKHTASDLAAQSRDTASDLAAQSRDTASNLAAQSRDTASNLAAQSRDTASDMSEAASENVRKLPQMGSTPINKASGTVSSAVGDAKQYMNSSASTDIDGNSNGNLFATGDYANVSQRATGAGSAKEIAL